MKMIGLTEKTEFLNFLQQLEKDGYLVRRSKFWIRIYREDAEDVKDVMKSARKVQKKPSLFSCHPLMVISLKPENSYIFTRKKHIINPGEDIIMKTLKLLYDEACIDN